MLLSVSFDEGEYQLVDALYYPPIKKRGGRGDVWAEGVHRAGGGGGQHLGGRAVDRYESRRVEEDQDCGVGAGYVELAGDSPGHGLNTLGPVGDGGFHGARQHGTDEGGGTGSGANAEAASRLPDHDTEERAAPASSATTMDSAGSHPLPPADFG